MTSETHTPETPPKSFVAFIGSRRLAAGAPGEVALMVKHALERGEAGPILVFDDADGRAVDLDLRGTDAEIAARRELEEETGYRAADWRTVGEFYSSPGMVSESFTLLVAKELTRVGDGGGVDGEDITVHRVPLNGIEDFIAAKRAEG